jgi:hypothetical protein
MATVIDPMRVTGRVFFVLLRIFAVGLYYAYTAKTPYQKFETNIPRHETARPRSQFPHSCNYERFIYFHDRSTYFAAGESIVGIYKSLTDT